MLNLFQFESYREILREVLLDRKQHFGNAYTFAKMAKFCRLQRTYLSTVLAGGGHLNSDQVYDAAQFLQLSTDEYQYLSCLHEYERSISPRRREVLGSEIKNLRDKSLLAESYVTAPALPQSKLQSHLSEFYLDINAQLVHMFLTVKRFSRDLESTRQALKLSKEVFHAALAKIERAGLARFENNKAEILKDSFHLPSTSELSTTYRLMMRLKALEAIQTQNNEQQFSFSVLYSAKADTRAKIQSRFLEFIDWVQQATQKDEPTDVFQMNFDLVSWSPEAKHSR